MHFISVYNFGQVFLAVHPPFCGHALVPWLSSSSGAVVVLKLLIWWSEGKKPPSTWKQGPLQLGGSTLCEGRRCQFITNPDTEGYLCITPPLFGLANFDPVPWVVVSVIGSLSNGVYGQQHHSLSQTYMFHQTSTPTTHYLESSPIISGCSGGHPW